MRLSRRSLLGLAALTLAGCHKAAKRPPATPPTVPDGHAIFVAKRIELDLLALYDTKIAAASATVRPQLVVQRAIHATHLKALGTSKVGAPDPATRGIKAVLRTSIGQLQRQAMRADSGANAALFASIAASHQVSLG